MVAQNVEAAVLLADGCMRTLTRGRLGLHLRFHHAHLHLGRWTNGCFCERWSGRCPRRKLSVRLRYVKTPGWRGSKFPPWRAETTITFTVEMMDQPWITSIHVTENEYHHSSCNTLELETVEPFIEHFPSTCSIEFTEDLITNTHYHYGHYPRLHYRNSAVISWAVWTQRSTEDFNTLSLIPLLTELLTTEFWLRERMRW